MELKQDLYIIPLSNGNLIYSPLRRGIFWANDEASQTIKSYLAGNKDILTQDETPVIKHIRKLENTTATVPLHYTEDSNKSSLVVIPSQTCNLACTYCYAHHAHAKECINKSVLIKAYDLILKGNNRDKCFSFIGGGEPLMAWDILKWSFEYISAHKSQFDNIFFNITTNATLLNKEIILTIKKYKVHINVSFDILKKVQDVQRPFLNDSNGSSFDIIHKNILMIDENNIPYSIRSTITEKNVSLMHEMVQFIIDNYHNLKSLHFEPVTGNLRNNSEYYNKYINSFFLARETAKKHGIDLYNSMTRSVFNIKNVFCNGEFCLTPTGHIVACHRISSIKDKYFNKFCYGKVTDSGIDIYKVKHQEFLRFSYFKNKYCKKCFAYWHCAGICPMERISLTETQLKGKCVFTREIIKRTLLEFIRK